MKHLALLTALVGALSACTVLPPLPPGTHFEPPRPRPVYRPVPVYQERAELRRVYPLMHERNTPRGREY